MSGLMNHPVTITERISALAYLVKTILRCVQYEQWREGVVITGVRVKNSSFMCFSHAFTDGVGRLYSAWLWYVLL